MPSDIRTDMPRIVSDEASTMRTALEAPIRGGTSFNTPFLQAR
jgi:hypothetical protein